MNREKTLPRLRVTSRQVIMLYDCVWVCLVARRCLVHGLMQPPLSVTSGVMSSSAMRARPSAVREKASAIAAGLTKRHGRSAAQYCWMQPQAKVICVRVFNILKDLVEASVGSWLGGSINDNHMLKLGFVVSFRTRRGRYAKAD